MAAITPEVWDPQPIIPVPGTYVSRFNRYYLSINPNPAEGPPTWRISDPDEYPCGEGILIPLPPENQEYIIATAAPLVVTGDTSDVDFSFNISSVPDTDVEGPRVITSIEGFNKLPLITSVTGNPIRVALDLNDNAVVISPQWSALDYAPKVITLDVDDTVTDYNSNEIIQPRDDSRPPDVVYTSSDPVELTPLVDVTQITLNIDSLLLAP